MEEILRLDGVTIPNKIIENQNLTALEKILFGLISTIQNDGKIFTKPNQTLSVIFSVTPQTISKSINKLKKT